MVTKIPINDESCWSFLNRITILLDNLLNSLFVKISLKLPLSSVDPLWLSVLT